MVSEITKVKGILQNARVRGNQTSRLQSGPKLRRSLVETKPHAKKFYHLNRPVMVCLALKQDVQCPYWSDSKSSW